MAKSKKPAKGKVKKIAPTGLVLPKGYLSWSQLDLWEKDKAKYKRQYFMGEKSYQNDAMRYGSHISDVFEGKAKPLDHVEQSVKLLAQKCGNPEREIRVGIKTNYGIVYLYGRVDDMEETPGGIFIENKTGTNKWTQKKANSHGQVHFYFVLIGEEKGQRPRHGVLQYLPTEEILGINQYHRRLTGEILPFIVEWNMGDEMEIRRRIENAAREIDVEYRAFINNQNENA